MNQRLLKRFEKHASLDDDIEYSVPTTINEEILLKAGERLIIRQK